jgi:hypothetical protein
VTKKLYGLHPDAFVPARDDAVAEARQAGDRDLARAIGRLRRPTRAAWLANLLARERAEQLDGLLALAGDLATAQRTLDGGALRALSAQRSRLVAAMAREGGRLAAQAGDSATESVVRDLTGILDAALADPAIAAEVRSGRLTRTVSYSGFGPGPGSAPAAPAAGRADAGSAVPDSRADRDGDGGRTGSQSAATGGRDRPDGGDEPAGNGSGDAGNERAERERAERERREQERAEVERRRIERAEREQALADAERAADDARDQQEATEAARADADAAHEAAKAQVTDLASELEAARERERATASAARAANAAARDAAREASTAAARADRARGRLAELA